MLWAFLLQRLPCHELEITAISRRAAALGATDAMGRLVLRFERGPGNAGGSGLGLSIIKAIADRTGMKITVVSPKVPGGAGVEIQVQLPLDYSADPEGRYP